MNEIIQNAERVFCNISSDFSSLWKYKLRGETLEIITPFSTLTGSFISVFLTQRENRFIVTDGQRLIQHLTDLEMLNKRACVYLAETASHYSVKKTQTQNSNFYFKSTTDINLLSAYIYDLVFFQNAALNSIYAEATFFNKNKDEQLFSTRANNILQQKIDESTKYQKMFSLDRSHNLIHSAGFGSVLTRTSSNNIWAAMYITGSTPTNFCSTIYRANTGFMYVKGDENLKQFIKIAAVIDDQAKGNIMDNERVRFAKKIMGVCNPHIYTFDEFRNKNIEDLYASA